MFAHQQQELCGANTGNANSNICSSINVGMWPRPAAWQWAKPGGWPGHAFPRHQAAQLSAAGILMLASPLNTTDHLHQA